MTPTQDDVSRWAALIAAGYANDCVPIMTPIDVRNLATYLGGPLADCLMLAIPPRDWGPHYVDPALDRWEVNTRRRRGRRLGAVDYAKGRLTMD